MDKRELLRKLYDTYYRPLCFYAGKYVPDMDDVKDIVQDVYVAAWERDVDFPSALAAKSWLYTSVYNACMNHLKRAEIHSHHHELLRNEWSEADEHNYISGRIESEWAWQLFRTVETLPEECRKVFKLSYVNGKSIEEVAALLNLSVNTVKSQRARARKLLQERLKHTLLGLLLTAYVMLLMKNALLR